ncbi:carbohydrate ABC transporter permease [Pseudoflavonifractor sp. 524-17]|uniref:carbohydrate ABC transporter permease n=1 Tax=Pseudoflavonifractor sp. 524-17 TaxID=2304577 RepID=UPI00137B12D7|nr:carbohydrate ABC transporter permease [Pseudoflavonifractor sp. 524-17]NCE64569.1 carbohydrate ABC transporter permease [Pseudoflavonifractor sp. 524-17]
MRQEKKISPYFIVSVILLVLLAIFFIFPLYWIITGSVKEKSDIIVKAGQSVKWIPTSISWDNYARLFKSSTQFFGAKIPMAIRWLFNSVFISVVAMLLTCVTASLAGYVLAKKRFWGRGVVFSLFVCAMALPKQVILIPLLQQVSNMGFLSSKTPVLSEVLPLFAVICPVVGWPFGVFLMKQFSENIPTSLLEAARIDGAGELTTFINVAFPIIKPGFGALAIFTFINAWNEYPLQLVMLQQDSVKTISLGIASLQSEMSNDYGLIMAGAALAAVPIIIVFLCFQKYFTQGITMGAVKG